MQTDVPFAFRCSEQKVHKISKCLLLQQNLPVKWISHLDNRKRPIREGTLIMFTCAYSLALSFKVSFCSASLARV